MNIPLAEASTMLNNYEYFIALAEEKNISKAAEKLYISHQALSRYLKTLEQSYQISFFDRDPRLKLTPAGEAYLEMLRNIRFLEQNFENQLNDIRTSRRGKITLGLPEGRFRLLIPEILPRFKEMYPEVELNILTANTHSLCESIFKNDLDLAMINQSDLTPSQYEIHSLFREKLYLVISDDLLETWFPGRWPACKEDFRNGVDLADFQAVPFVLNRSRFHSRMAVDQYLLEHNLTLNCVMELTQTDLHYLLAARDYAACFCWSMFIPMINDLNANPVNSHLNAFPIRGLTATNSFVLIHSIGRIYPAYTNDLIKLIRSVCNNSASAPIL